MLESYRNARAYPFCPGCGHGLILDHLNTALVRLGLPPHRVVIVSDIGCQGLGDQYFITHAFHGLHGRSVAYATGIKLADPDLKVIVLIGDGGIGIGAAHWLSAARRNIGLTVLVMNNFNFGMTGGEHSATTPTGGVTATTRGGNLERPLDLCATAAANGAGFVWRGTAFDRELADVIVEAVQGECFALLDIWELCTAHYVPNNAWSRRALIETRAALGMPAGLVHRGERPEYARLLAAAAAGQHVSAPGLRGAALTPQFAATLDREFRLVIAGSAGGKIRSTARTIGEAALLSGLWAAQQDDYPVTVQTGHSISTLIFGPREILFTGSGRPDALVLVTEEGRKAAGRYLRALTRESWLFTTPEFAGLDTPAQKVVIDSSGLGTQRSRKNLGLLLSAAALRRLRLFPIEALEAAIRGERRKDVAAENLAAVAASAAVQEAGRRGA
ncbi:MAG: 2-oxoglutarate oxidoreductase subunit KorB [Chloroflexi bacterium ADurb.Bin325]|nr:MAG: 2-oxoglutarate oxidoreductase subunit KorB [Chloroflexi bacterium ADurb.Bin325]